MLLGSGLNRPRNGRETVGDALQDFVTLRSSGSASRHAGALLLLVAHRLRG
jgi:hypothetical protein